MGELRLVLEVDEQPTMHVDAAVGERKRVDRREPQDREMELALRGNSRGGYARGNALDVALELRILPDHPAAAELLFHMYVAGDEPPLVGEARTAAANIGQGRDFPRRTAGCGKCDACQSGERPNPPHRTSRVTL